MKAPIPFVEELRSELLTHALGVQGSKLPVREHRGIRRGPLIAVVAFAIVVAVGGTMWMLRPAGVGPDVSEPPSLAAWDLSVSFPVPEDPDAVVASVEAIPGIDEVIYLPDISVLHLDPDTTQEGGVEEPNAGLLARLESDANPLEVAGRVEYLLDGQVQLSDAVLRTLDADFISLIEAEAEQIDGDPLLLRPAPGPAPQFDPSALGRNVPLTLSTDIARLVSQLDQPSLTRDLTAPVIFVGQVEELGMDLLLAPTTRYGYCTYELSGDGSSGIGCGMPDEMHYGVAGAGSPPGYVTTFVPLETSVVVVTTEFSDPVWQQPVGGWGLLPVKVLVGKVAVDAYDQVGNLLGHWEEDF